MVSFFSMIYLSLLDSPENYDYPQLIDWKLEHLGQYPYFDNIKQRYETGMYVLYKIKKHLSNT